MQYDFPGEGKPITSSWVARVWDPAVRERFQLLIKKLAEIFDGKIYGINLPVTAVDLMKQNYLLVLVLITIFIQNLIILPFYIKHFKKVLSFINSSALLSLNASDLIIPSIIAS